jgi:hypothetical protein
VVGRFNFQAIAGIGFAQRDNTPMPPQFHPPTPRKQPIKFAYVGVPTCKLQPTSVGEAGASP